MFMCLALRLAWPGIFTVRACRLLGGYDSYVSSDLRAHGSGLQHCIFKLCWLKQNCISKGLQMAALHGNTALHTLSMKHNQLAATAAQAIGDMLLHNVGLRTLALSWNSLGPTAGEMLARGIPYNVTLQVSAPLIRSNQYPVRL